MRIHKKTLNKCVLIVTEKNITNLKNLIKFVQRFKKETKENK